MKLTLASAAAVLLATAAPASATEFVFTGGTNPASWTKDGVTLKVSGWYTPTTATTSTPVAGVATAWTNYGYGIVDLPSDDKHTIDNSLAYDFLRLEFNRAVTLNSVGLKQFGDTDAWISYGSGTADQMKSTEGWKAFVANGSNDYTGPIADRTFNVGKNVAATVWLVGASRNGGSDDSFKLASVNVAAVPEPATWALMILGFGLTGYALRRRPIVRMAARAA